MINFVEMTCMELALCEVLRVLVFWRCTDAVFKLLQRMRTNGRPEKFQEAAAEVFTYGLRIDNPEISEAVYQ